MFKRNLKMIVFTVALVSVGSALIKGEAGKMGPFPIKRTSVTQLAFNFEHTIEKPVSAASLARTWGCTNQMLTLTNSFDISVPVIDPTTGLPQVDPQGKPVVTIVNYPAGTILSPATDPSDDITLPIGAMITCAAIADGPKTIGRFAYVGNVPRFAGNELEMTASKMSHSLRVKAWVTPAIVNGYELALLNRFKGFYDAFTKPTMHFETLQSFEKMAANTKSRDKKRWYQVAAMYSKHALAGFGLDIYDNTASEQEYKNTILTTLLRSLMNDPNATIQTGLDLLARYNADATFIQTRESNSKALFQHHLGDRYTLTPGMDPTRPDRLGFLTFIYPIAIDKRGPFMLPGVGTFNFPGAASIEGRWWSNLWLDEFGGFPFLQITGGVAFHGPITNFQDSWYLRRDNVSHSCMRMDPSDLLELRALIPKALKNKTPIALNIIEWPDVTDTNNDGINEVVDVAYYSMPTDGSPIQNPANWAANLLNKNWWKKMYSPYMKRLPKPASFTVTTASVVNPTTGATEIVNTGTFIGLPKYEMVNGKNKITSYYPEPIQIKTYPQRPTAIIQYREDGISYNDASWGGDTNGSYPPKYFNQL